MALYQLPKLSFGYEALEPFIDGKTMEVHHDGHHKEYVTQLNAVLEEYPSFQKHIEELLASLETLPLEIKTKVKNNAGGHANHSLFWSILTPKDPGEPRGTLSESIVKNFGSVSNFREKFTEMASDYFSNGWAWLCVDPKDELKLLTTKDHESPISRGLTPLLVLDLWEHAYYLKYQNRRAEYVRAFWNVVNWEEISKRWDEFQEKGATDREWRNVG